MLALAIDDFRNAVHLNPADREANYRLARALAQNRRFEEAAEFFETALAIGPDIPDIYVDYGMVLHELGLREKALEHVRKALRLQPGFPSATKMLERWSQ
jgi:tetratricopeptide (TPR) repeat protein